MKIVQQSCNWENLSELVVHIILLQLSYRDQIMKAESFMYLFIYLLCIYLISLSIFRLIISRQKGKKQYKYIIVQALTGTLPNVKALQLLSSMRSNVIQRQRCQWQAIENLDGLFMLYRTDTPVFSLAAQFQKRVRMKLQRL